MLNANEYIFELLERLKNQFGSRLVYVGLQGSYLRGEATENSDIDIMVIIDGLSVVDLNSYRELIYDMGDYEKSCGFICSKADMAAWNPLEICNLLHCTKDYYGVLADLIPEYSKEDVRNFARMSLNNLYHEICHRYIHSSWEKNAEQILGSYKSVFFILQTVVYLRTGNFVTTKQELLSCLSGTDRTVLETAMNFEDEVSFEEAFETLFFWCQQTLISL